jgi:hypothetical protein
MKWSFSHSKTFRKCQLQWYLATHFACANAKKNPLQREAYLLSKLQSVFAWRGGLVDTIISDKVVPALSSNSAVGVEQALAWARRLFDEQLAFAQTRRWREDGMTVDKASGAYAALHGVEYGYDISEEIDQAWKDVKSALGNLLRMGELMAELKTAVRLIPQRNLSFDLFGVTVKARPDLIAFFDDRPPLIVDWKVHTYAQHDYRLQLAVYALVLKNSKAHSDFDFPLHMSPYSITDIRLLEAQLLTGYMREYQLSDGDIDDVENYIGASSAQMLLLSEADAGEEVFPELGIAAHPEICQRCNFRRFCWEGTLSKKEATCPVSKQTSFLF